MNKESKSKNPDIDPELEARMVAMVLGESSDLERDGLNRLIEDRPELAAFKAEIESLHGLLRDVSTGELLSEDDDWKLPADKRSKVLEVFGGEEEPQSENEVLKLSPETERLFPTISFGRYRNVAAVLCIVGSVATMATLGVFYKIGGKDDAMPLAASTGNSRRTADKQELYHRESARSGAGSHGTRAQIVLSDGAETAVEFEDEFLKSGRTWDVDDDDERDSKSALSAIRDNLAKISELQSSDYLADDVASYSVSSGLAFPQEPTAPGRTRVADNRKPSSQENGSRSESPSTSDFGRLGGGVELGWAYQPIPKFGIQADVPSVPLPSGGNTYSLPAIDGSINGLNDVELDSVISVPDGGTVLLGGVKRLLEQREPDEKPKAGSGVGRSDDELAKGDKRQGQSEKEVQDFKKKDSGKSNNNFNAPSRVAGPQNSAPVELSSPQQVPLSGGTDLRLLVELPNLLDDSAQEVDRVEGKLQNWSSGLTGGYGGGGGDGFGGGGFGGGETGFDETAPSAGRDRNSPTDQPEDMSSFDSGVWLDANGLELPAPAAAGPAPAKPATVDVGGRLAEQKARLGFESVDGFPSPVPSPPVQRRYAREYFSEELQTDDGETEGFAGNGVTIAGEANITFQNRRDQGRGERNVRIIPMPITDFESDEFVGEKQVRRADSNAELSSEYRAKTSLKELSRMNRLDGITKNSEDSPLDAGVSSHTVTNGTRRQSVPIDVQKHLFWSDGRSQEAGLGRWESYVPPTPEKKPQSLEKTWEKKSSSPAALEEVSAEKEAFSTFSLHVSDVSFKLAQAALGRGEWPEKAKIRIEEFVNAFDYGDPLPCRDEKVSCRLEQSIHPFLQQRNLLRVSMRTAAAGRSSKTPLRLTLLLDNSGSMERIDRRQTVRRAFALLAQQLKPIDQVTLISFARQPRLLADKVSGTESSQLVGLVENLPSEGGTNIEAALQLAFEKAKEQQVDAAQNRIVLLTDGAVNLGDANPESLSRMITTMRDMGIAFDAAGISAEGLNDEVLEALTRQGDGRYYLLDSVESADDGFARQIAGALRPSAKNVKVQIEFNPKRVGRYKLLGYEKHRLKQEDFRNDAVDAAEMAAAEAGVAVYQFEARPDGEGDIGLVSVRFRDLSTGQMIENTWPIPYEADAPRVDQAAPSLRIATSAALLAAKLRGEPLGATVDLKTLSNLIAGLPDRERGARRVVQLQQMIGQARQLSGQ